MFAYIKNMSATGKYYWVIAHVTPSFDRSNNIVGYHSNRRYPNQSGIQNIIPLYNEVLKLEASCSSPKEGLEKGFALLESSISVSGKSYEEFI